MVALRLTCLRRSVSKQSPEMGFLGGGGMEKVIPVQNAQDDGSSEKKNAMERYNAMRQVNMAQMDQEEDMATVSRKRKERRAADLKRRTEIMSMEKEDYTHKPEGVLRRLRLENRLLMQQEDSHSKKHRLYMMELERKKMELKKKKMEKEKRDQLLKERKQQEAKRLEEQKQNEIRLAQERQLRVQKLKLAAEERARAAEQAKLEKEHQIEKEKRRKAQELQQEEFEREEMTAQEEYERDRIQRQQEQDVLQAKIHAEELKWKLWEEEEQKREEEATRKRRQAMAKQYAEDRERRANMHKLKKQKKETITADKKAFKPAASFRNIKEATEQCGGRKGLVSVASKTSMKSSACSLSSTESNKVLIGKPLDGMSTSMLLVEEKRCNGLKRKTKAEIKAWTDSFKANQNGVEPNAMQKEAIQPLYLRYAALEDRIQAIKTMLEGKIDNQTSPASTSDKENSYNLPVASITTTTASITPTKQIAANQAKVAETNDVKSNLEITLTSSTKNEVLDTKAKLDDYVKPDTTPPTSCVVNENSKTEVIDKTTEHTNTPDLAKGDKTVIPHTIDQLAVAQPNSDEKKESDSNISAETAPFKDENSVSVLQVDNSISSSVPKSIENQENLSTHADSQDLTKIQELMGPSVSAIAVDKLPAEQKRCIGLRRKCNVQLKTLTADAPDSAEFKSQVLLSTAIEERIVQIKARMVTLDNSKDDRKNTNAIIDTYSAPPSSLNTNASSLPVNNSVEDGIPAKREEVDEYQEERKISCINKESHEEEKVKDTPKDFEQFVQHEQVKQNEDETLQLPTLLATNMEETKVDSSFDNEMNPLSEDEIKELTQTELTATQEAYKAILETHKSEVDHPLRTAYIAALRLLMEQLQMFDKQPFARITEISLGSPAESAGLIRNDFISQFGRIKYRKGRKSSELVQDVQGCIPALEDQIVNIVVQRFAAVSWMVREIELLPCEWDENGSRDLVGWKLEHCIGSSNKKCLVSPAAFALVERIDDISPASDAGICPGDQIVKLANLHAYPNDSSEAKRLLFVSLQRFIHFNELDQIEATVQRIIEDEPVVVKVQIFPEGWLGSNLCGMVTSPIQSSKESFNRLEFVNLPAFLQVSNVEPLSPAHLGGLLNGDLIVQVGGHSKSLIQISEVIKKEVGKPIEFVVRRWFDAVANYETTIMTCILTENWSTGSGALGCVLSEWHDYEDVEAEEIEETDIQFSASLESDPSNTVYEPFLVVETVDEDSPASEAGLRVGDFIIKFGTVEALLDNDMSVIASTVESSANHPLSLLVQRWEGWEYVTATLQLQPKTWQGEGLLGCNIISYTAYIEKSEQIQGAYPCAECLSSKELATSAHSAAFLGHYECMEYLSQYFDVYCLDDYGRSPLFFACFANQCEIVSFLVSIYPECVNYVDVNGDTGLHAATSSGALECIEFLADNDADLTCANNDGITPAHIAPNSDVLDLLYSRGADFLALDALGKLPLHHACAASEEKCVAYLCDALPDFIDAQDNLGNTPMHDAAENGFLNGIQLLLSYSSDKKASLLTKNKNNDSVLEISKKHESCYIVLVKLVV